MASQFYNLGRITNPGISDAPGYSECLYLKASTLDGQRVVLLISDGAARMLWSALTKILYPRAADQLTQRAETAIAYRGTAPNVTHIMNAEYREEDDLIQVDGIGKMGGWTIGIEPDEGHNLWTELEDIFHNVGRGG